MHPVLHATITSKVGQKRKVLKQKYEALAAINAEISLAPAINDYTT